MQDVQGNNVLSCSLWGAEHSCFSGIAFVTSFAWVRQRSKECGDICVSGNGCTTPKGRQPWIPRGINTWGECSICFRLYEQKWNCKYIFEPFLNSCYKIGFIFLHANQQLYAGPCSLCPLKAGLSGKIKPFKRIFCFKCFVCSAKTCWDAEDKVFLEIKLTPVSTGSLFRDNTSSVLTLGKMAVLANGSTLFFYWHVWCFHIEELWKESAA